jgi:Xaa-Pro aminopeptidase
LIPSFVGCRTPAPRHPPLTLLPIEFISGFSGSAGTAIVSLTKAALSTDGRYFNQASKQLDSNWVLLKRGVEGVQTWQEWTTEQAEGGKVVGVDPALITACESLYFWPALLSI